MHKLLIVDDEQVEREGLQAILHKGFPDLNIEQAKNGTVAIAKAREFKPDLVLMDIKMPGISGLEAIEQIGGEYPHMKFIMVTAYDMFDYARQALKLGVKDYLLKPSRAGEIIETVGRALEEIERERSDTEERRNEIDALMRMRPVVEADVVTQLLFDHVHEVHLEEMVGWLGGDTTREAFVMLFMLAAAPSPDTVYSSLKEKIGRLKSGWVGALSGNQIPIVVFRESGKSYRSQASSLVQQLLTLQQRARGTECFIGIGNPYGSFDDLRLSYQEALISTADVSLPSKHRFYAEIPALEVLKEDYPSKQSEKQFIEHIRLGKWEQVQSFVMDHISLYEKNAISLLQAQQRVLESLWIISRVMMEMGIKAEKPYFSFQVQDYRQLRSETASLTDRLAKTMEVHNSRVEPDIVHQIKQYIIEHSQEDISLESIAERVGLSPFYVSKMFKEMLGVNYIDFLTECRINKAKALLLDPEKSLKEITYEVGYNDPNYFSKVFKKASGLSPTDYRKTALGKKV